jgi:methionine-rich copper-binding protein CopC
MKPSALVALLASAVLAAAAHAHTPLASSVPAEKSAVPAPVEQLELAFGGDVRLTAVALADAAGERKAVGDIPAAVAARFVVPIRDDLAPGDYVATWRAVGADTHVISGEIHFTVTAKPSR